MPNPKDTFLEQLPLIERITRSICRERGMDHAAAEEFSAFVKLRLIEKDYAIIAKFKERSAFGTFITTVISRMLNDYRDHLWGKWRNSAAAVRLGAMAMELERLVSRDARSLDEAFAELVTKYPHVTRKELAQMAVQFPPRYRPRFSSLEDVSADPGYESRDLVRTETALRISSIISTFIGSLSGEDQLILQMHFEDGLSVPKIAQMLRLDLQSIYRRLNRHFRDLRAALEKEGIRGDDVAPFIGEGGSLFDFRLKSGKGRPSNDDEGSGGNAGGNAE